MFVCVRYFCMDINKISNNPNLTYNKILHHQYRPMREYYHSYFWIIVIVCTLCIWLSIYAKSLVWKSQDVVYSGQNHTFSSQDTQYATQDENQIPNWWHTWEQAQDTIPSSIHMLDIEQIQQYIQDLKHQSDQLAQYYHDWQWSGLFEQQLNTYMQTYYGR
jgi:hypothetical protein